MAMMTRTFLSGSSSWRGDNGNGNDLVDDSSYVGGTARNCHKPLADRLDSLRVRCRGAYTGGAVSQRRSAPFQSQTISAWCRSCLSSEAKIREH